MSNILKVNSLIKIDKAYTIITEEGAFNSTDSAQTSGNLNNVAATIKSGAPFHTSVAIQTSEGPDVTFDFSEKTKLEEAFVS